MSSPRRRAAFAALIVAVVAVAGGFFAFSWGERATTAPTGGYHLPVNSTGWTTTSSPFSWNNYTLPNWPGTSAWPDGSKDSPVVTPTTVYYVNLSESLVAYSLTSGEVEVLHSWPTNLSDSGSPAILTALTNTTGTPEILFEVGTVFDRPTQTTTLYGCFYDLSNGSYWFGGLPFDIDFNATDGNDDLGWGLLPSGWFYEEAGTGAFVEAYNVYSGDFEEDNLTPLSGWNSPVYIPSAGQVVEDINDDTFDSGIFESARIEVRAFGLVDGALSVSTFFSSPEAFFSVGQDTNNMPYFYAFSATGTFLWGIGSNGYNGTYHLLTLSLGATPSQDYVYAVEDTGFVGTTDTQSVAIYDPTGYSLNGRGVTSPNASFQSPLLNPLTRSTIVPTEGWFASVFNATLAYGPEGWTNEWEATGFAPYSGAVELDASSENLGGLIVTYSQG